MYLLLYTGLVLMTILPQESIPKSSARLITAILASDEATALRLVDDLDIAELQVADRVHGSPLMIASRAGKDEIVKRLLARGVAVNQWGSPGRTALHEAAGQAKLTTCRVLLHAGADPNAFSEHVSQTGESVFGLSPLDSAVHSGDVDVLNILIDAGGDPFLHASDHGSCLFRIADDPTHLNRKQSLTKVTKRLLELGCDPNEVVGSRTPLINAVWRLDPVAVEVYLDACPGLDVNLIPDGGGLSAIHSAVVLPSGRRDHVERVRNIVRLLLKHGADPSQKSLNGDSALSAKKDVSIERVLLDAIQEQD
jgi:ankyrin repeat protein